MSGTTYNQKHGFGHSVEMRGQNGMKWRRTEYDDGFATPWMFVFSLKSQNLELQKLGTIDWSGFFNFYVPKQQKQSAKPQNLELQKLKGIDWSNFTGQPTVVNGYEITVRKLGPKAM